MKENDNNMKALVYKYRLIFGSIFNFHIFIKKYDL